MNIVADASAVATLLLPDEAGVQADAVRAVCREATLYVPPHWPVEVANYLWKARRRDRLDEGQLSRALHLAQILSRTVTIVADARMAQLVPDALRWQLSAYDAAYLIAAQTTGATLLTFDRRLAEAARGEQIEVLPA